MQAGSNSLSPYLPILIFAFVAAWLCFICFLISVGTGWHRLSKRFPAQSEPYGQTKSAGPFFYTVYMRFWGHYSSIIRMTAADDALYLSVLLPFRLGHPPLCIPWSEITFGKDTFLWKSYIVLTLGNVERIPMRISERMARNLGIMERLPVDALPH
jgi:hypothetical protein